MNKTVSFGARPSAAKPAPTAEQWVERREAQPKAMRRLAVDIPDDLHKRIKAACAMRGTKIADEVRKLLDDHFKD